MEKQYCDQCENKCPIDALSCGKGRRHFGMEPSESGKERHGRKMPDGVIGLLMQCGHVLHHGGADDQDLLQVLKLQEQAELERILKILLDDWKMRMPAGRPEHKHCGWKEATR